MKIDVKKLKATCESLNLLYVEDDANARVAMFEFLQRFFQNITVAIDGKDGLEKFKNDSFDLIITDVKMPHMSGIEMLKDIRTFDRLTPVLVFSAHNEAEFFLQTLRLGVDDYLLKPLEYEQFLSSLEKVVERIDLKKQLQTYQLQLEDEVKNRTQELHNKLYYDDLTSLLSRYAFFEDIQTVQTPVIFLIDIDKFKLINEIYGLKTGSLVLQEFAKFLQDFVHESEYKVYRLSADEFVLMKDAPFINYDLYEQTVENFFKQLTHFQVQFDNDSITIDVTVGISIAQKNALECAKTALENAKENKKSYVTYFVEMDLLEEKKDTLLWKNKIKSAVEEHRIIPVYQAIVNDSGEIVKYEALMRLEEKGSAELISPYFFLDTAIKTKLYDSLSSTIIFNALELAKKSNNILSINFTFTDIKNELFINSIADYLSDHENLGEQLVFEITESENIESFNLVKEFIQRFRAHGVKFAIDDFGSGYSNFQHILEMQPDYLKIDGSLVRNIDKDESSYILVKAIIDFSHKLGISIIAEFVHTKKIFSLLKELHVDEYQGFYFHKPQRKTL